jgi:SAM-dependent methyltransferase
MLLVLKGGNIMKNKNCKLLYQVDKLPIFQNRMYTTKAEAIACPRGDVWLVEDLDSGLIYNSQFNSELMQYDSAYQNEQALSSVFKEHLQLVSRIIDRSIGRSNLVEVGCGKGYFLEALLKYGFDVTGFDPSYEGDNEHIRCQHFEPSSGILADGLILRHVLEHIEDPVNFLFQLSKANGAKGRIYIEVPCFNWICDNRVWFDIYYEHVNYFRLTDFSRIFGEVIESGHLFGGQYIYVVAELSSLRVPKRDYNDPVFFPKDFDSHLPKASNGNGHSVAIWGGASKGVIFSLLMARVGIKVSIVIDINPAKQGLFLPATGLLVSSPDEVLSNLKAGSDLYVMNSNYLEEIKKISSNRFTYIRMDYE